MVSVPHAAFARLGVSYEASAEEVRRAWLSQARHLHPDAGGDEASMQRLNADYEACCQYLVEREGTVAVDDEVMTRDAPSFVVEALPVVTFEALLVATTWLGEVLVDEPPYLLEVHLFEPAPCWCRLELVPDAGATTVSLTVAGVDGETPPSAMAVRDRWITVLNELPLPD